MEEDRGISPGSCYNSFYGWLRKKDTGFKNSQNQNIIHEIDNILDEDRKMKEVLSRKSRITSLLRDNNDTLERSVNNLDKYVNCTSYDNYSYDRPSSQRLTYQFQERSYI